MVTGPLLSVHVNWKGTPVTIPDQESSVKWSVLAALTMAPHSSKIMKRLMESLRQSARGSYEEKIYWTSDSGCLEMVFRLKVWLIRPPPPGGQMIFVLAALQEGMACGRANDTD